jgi:hypothetical protein
MSLSLFRCNAGPIHMIEVDDKFSQFLERRMRERERERRRKAATRLSITCILLALAILTGLALHYGADVEPAKESTEIDLAK